MSRLVNLQNRNKQGVRFLPQWKTRGVLHGVRVLAVLGFLGAVLVMIARTYPVVPKLECAPNCIAIDLRGRNLSEAYLRHINLGRANLNAANLTESDLYFANLTEANLRNADLQEADLSQAILHYTD
ncbi:MAG: pentapeptide repeat-containing protein, partial [Caldilineaceae bacterium]|nr:pentapeptide repeat-containing protein [Caldilineaceae bacterium]